MDIITENKKLIVIGGGPAGLAAAIEAYKTGIAPDDILIIERDRELGGILNQCIHAGFGLHIFGEELTGPEYANRFITEIKNFGIGYITDAMALSVSSERIVTYVSPATGYKRVSADSVILAMGCRERTRGALNIPGSRPSGIFSAGTAQRYVNIEGYMPGKRVVILGSGDIGLIMARRMTLEGAQVLCVCEIMPYSGGLARNVAQCLDDFDIPLHLSHTVTKIHGKERLEGVTIAKVGEDRKIVPETEQFIECDTLLLSVGLIPENELTRGADIEIDPVTGGAVVNQRMETSVEGIFSCGNVLQVHDLVDFVTEEAYRAGHAAALFIKELYSNGQKSKIKPVIKTISGKGIRYVVPQKIETDSILNTKIFFRSDNIYRNTKIKIASGGVIIKEIKKQILTPGEMESITFDEKLSDKINEIGSSEVEITL